MLLKSIQILRLKANLSIIPIDLIPFPHLVFFKMYAHSPLIPNIFSIFNKACGISAAP